MNSIEINEKYNEMMGCKDILVVKDFLESYKKYISGWMKKTYEYYKNIENEDNEKIYSNMKNSIENSYLSEHDISDIVDESIKLETQMLRMDCFIDSQYELIDLTDSVESLEDK